MRTNTFFKCLLILIIISTLSKSQTKFHNETAKTFTYNSNSQITNPQNINSILKTDNYYDPYTGWEGHYGYFSGSVFVDEEKELWTCGYDGIIRVWDWKNGKQIQAFSPDGKQIKLLFTNKANTEVYAFSTNYDFFIYDAATKKIINSVSFNTNFSYTPVMSENCDKMLMYDLMELKIKLIDFKTKNVIFSRPANKGKVTAMAVSKNIKYEAFAGTDKIIKIYKIATGDSIIITNSHGSQINSLLFTLDEKYLVSASSDKTIKVWNLENGSNAMTLVGHTNSVKNIYFDNDGKRMLSISDDYTAKIWSVDNWNLQMTILSSGNSLIHGAFSAKSNKIIISGLDYFLRVFDGSTGNEDLKFNGHQNCIVYSSFFDNDSKIMTASYDKTLKIWDSQTGTLLHSLEGHTKDISIAAVSRDGKRAASFSFDYTVKLWDLTTGSLLKSIPSNSFMVNAIALNSDGSKIIVSGNNSIKIIDSETGADIKNIPTPFSNLYQLIINKENNKVAGTNLSSILIMDLETGMIIKQSPEIRNIQMLVSNDDLSSLYFGGTYINTIYKWNSVENKVTNLAFTSHSDLAGMAYNEENNIIVTTGTDPTIRLWDAGTGKIIKTIYYNNLVGGPRLSITKDGSKILVAGTGLNSIRLYDISKIIQKIAINGKVTLPGTYPGFFNITLSGDQELKCSVDSTGSFFFNVCKGSYTLKPYFPGFTFSPDSITLNNLTENVSLNFTMKYFLPQTPVLLSPAPPNNSNMPCDIEFKWNPALEADTYILKVSTDPSCEKPIYSIEGLTKTSHTLYGLPSGSNLYWQVKGVNKNGTGNGISNYFFTAQTNTPKPVSSISENHVFPDNESILLKWSAVPNASFYDVQVAMDKSFNSTAYFFTQVKDSALSINKLQRNTKLFFRVRAYSNKQYSDWSESVSFSIEGNPPPKPALIAPERNANVIIDSCNSMVTLKWNSVPNSIYYNIEVALDKNFNGTKFYTNAVSTTHATVCGIDKSKTYYWRVNAVNYAGISDWSEVWSFNPKVTGIENSKTIPDDFVLNQNYPNPFNPSTKIEYALPYNSFVTLKIFNSIGKEIETLVKGNQEAGSHSITWEAKSIPSGVYFYKMETGKFNAYRKMLLIK